ncbi:MAG: hypothetical protein CMM23_09530 [Rhodospirillaceae bacterium]|nr:hypothetical protein [Rhodospirillaceae bacterium]
MVDAWQLETWEDYRDVARLGRSHTTVTACANGNTSAQRHRSPGSHRSASSLARQAHQPAAASSLFLLAWNVCSPSLILLQLTIKVGHFFGGRPARQTDDLSKLGDVARLFH